jgi:hypothetical protein
VPSIVTQPASQTGECGGSVAFSVGVTGDGPLSYQWYFGSMSIAGATDNMLVLGGLSLANAGSYSVVVGNAGGSVTSSVVTLAVADTAAPVLSLPANIKVARTSLAGADVTFAASASDACAGSVPVNCTPASGSTFALGVTTVSCSASDGNGNSATGSFIVTVELGFTYQDSDLLLVFRKEGFNDVLFNLGNVSNFIGQASGTVMDVGNFDVNLVRANFGGSLRGVSYALIAVTPVFVDGTPLRAWLSDGDLSGAPQDETLSAWSAQRSKISAIGLSATSYFNSSNQSLVLK